MKDRLSLGAVQLRRLLPEESIDVGVPSVGVRTPGDGEGLQPGRRVSGGPTEEVNDVPVLLLGISLEECGALERTELEMDPHGLEGVDDDFAPAGHLEVGRVLAGVEAVRIASLHEEALGPGGVVRI